VLYFESSTIIKTSKPLQDRREEEQGRYIVLSTIGCVIMSSETIKAGLIKKLKLISSVCKGFVLWVIKFFCIIDGTQASKQSNDGGDLIKLETYGGRSQVLAIMMIRKYTKKKRGGKKKREEEKIHLKM